MQISWKKHQDAPSLPSLVSATPNRSDHEKKHRFSIRKIALSQGPGFPSSNNPFGAQAMKKFSPNEIG